MYLEYQSRGRTPRSVEEGPGTQGRCRADWLRKLHRESQRQILWPVLQSDLARLMLLRLQQWNIRLDLLCLRFVPAGGALSQSLSSGLADGTPYRFPQANGRLRRDNHCRQYVDSQETPDKRS